MSLFRNKALLIFLSTLSCLSCERTEETPGRHHSLPCVEIDIDENYLWSPDSGLYVIGRNGIPSNCMLGFAANYNQKWEYPATFRFYPEGLDESVIENQVGFRIKGNCSREKAMKSVGLYWRSEYGSAYAEYPFFPDLGIGTFKRLLLRNSGNDFGLTHMKDAAMAEIIKEYARVEYASYRPVILYLNQEYWGIHNLREMLTPHHFSCHYGVDEDLVDLLGGSPLAPYADDGSAGTFLSEVIDYVKTHDLAEDEYYHHLAQLIDMENLMDYFIIETYTMNRDWPLSNMKWWREDRTDGAYNKWKWILYDLDAAFAPENLQTVWIGDLIGDDHRANKEDGFFLLNQLIRNEAFTGEFIGRYMFFLDTVYDPDRVEKIIREMMDRLQEEYPAHSNKWHTLKPQDWKRAVEDMIEWNRQRNRIMKELITPLYEAV